MHSLNIHVVVYTLEFNLIHLASGKWSAMFREVVCIPAFKNKASPDYPTTYCLSPSWVKFWHLSSSLSEQKTVLKRNNYAVFPITSNNNNNKKGTNKKTTNQKQNKTKTFPKCWVSENLMRLTHIQFSFFYLASKFLQPTIHYLYWTQLAYYEHGTALLGRKTTQYLCILSCAWRATAQVHGLSQSLLRK